MRYRAAKHLLVEELNDQTVILNLSNELAYTLSPEGSAFWRILAQVDGDFEAAFTHMLQEYEVDEATLRADLTALMTELTHEGLIEIAD